MIWNGDKCCVSQQENKRERGEIKPPSTRTSSLGRQQFDGWREFSPALTSACRTQFLLISIPFIFPKHPAPVELRIRRHHDHHFGGPSSLIHATSTHLPRYVVVVTAVSQHALIAAVYRRQNKPVLVVVVAVVVGCFGGDCGGR